MVGDLDENDLDLNNEEEVMKPNVLHVVCSVMTTEWENIVWKEKS